MRGFGKIYSFFYCKASFQIGFANVRVSKFLVIISDNVYKNHFYFFQKLNIDLLELLFVIVLNILS